jgi:cob(I)alamin adenosyltransferase
MEQDNHNTTLGKIITKCGDGGMTNLVYKDVHKSDLIIDCIGTIDESNASIGVARYNLNEVLTEFNPVLDKVQSNLFDLSADLICGSDRINEQYIQAIEDSAKEINRTLMPLTSFVLPKGPSSSIHLARTIVRRAERLFWAYHKSCKDNDLHETNKNPGIYLNRLSDLLFILCRYVSEKLGDEEEMWVRIK